ncbi:hypothetical protein GCM10028808_61920 [Spirosoma migulaei]
MNSSSSLTYFEDLAATGMTCPHEDAFVPNGERVYYRKLKSTPASSDCFLPTPINPARPLPKECDACVQKSVSVFDSKEELIIALKIQAGKGKKYLIGEVKLRPEDGMLKKTFSPGHHSWWRSAKFDINTVTIQEIQR